MKPLRIGRIIPSDWPDVINGYQTRPRRGACPDCDAAENKWCDLTCPRLDPMDHR